LAALDKFQRLLLTPSSPFEHYRNRHDPPIRWAADWRILYVSAWNWVNFLSETSTIQVPLHLGQNSG